MGMRGRQSDSSDEEADVNLTPMLDVVFIMLIFFIVTASFVKEAGIQIDRPEAKEAEKKGANILIAISATNEVWLQKRRIEPEQVRTNIERLLGETPEASVVIQADRRSKNGVFVKVFDQAKQAGVKEVAVSALKGNI